MGDYEARIYGKGCHFCFSDYVDSLEDKLNDIGITEIDIQYLYQNEEAEAMLEGIRDSLNVSVEMRSNIAAVFYDRYIFEGEIPAHIIIDFLVNHTDKSETLVVYLDKLKDTYMLVNETGDLIECRTPLSLGSCLSGGASQESENLLSVVLITGLLDGINPCAFSVLLFFIGLLLNSNDENSEDKNRKLVITGLAYISSVYVAYLAIGLSLYELVTVVSYLQWLASLSVALMIVLGLANIYDFFRGGRFKTSISTTGLMTIYDWMTKLTVPASIVAGFMVALFEFPCTGGVYFGIIGLLASESMHLEGLYYLILYNLAFIAPLIVIFALAVLGRLRNFSLSRNQHRYLKLFSGILFVVLGVYLLVRS